MCFRVLEQGFEHFFRNHCSTALAESASTYSSYSFTRSCRSFINLPVYGMKFRPFTANCNSLSVDLARSMFLNSSFLKKLLSIDNHPSINTNNIMHIPIYIPCVWLVEELEARCWFRPLVSKNGDAKAHE